MKLRYKVVLLVTAILISCISIVAYYSARTGYVMRKRVAQESMRHTATTIATIYATNKTDNNTQLNQVVDSLMNLESRWRDKGEGVELFYIFVLDRKRNPVVANVNFSLSRKYAVCLKNDDGEQIGKNDLDSKKTISKLEKLAIANLDRIEMPIKVNGTDYGVVEIAYFARQFETTERLYLVLYLLSLSVLCVLGVGVAIYISIRITDPIQNVVHAMNKLAGGDLQYRLKVDGNDEVVKLANGFNRMADSIKRKQDVIQKNEEQMSLSERKYKVLFNNAGVGIILLDQQKRCVEANERAEKILGWPTDMLKGAKLIDLIEPIADKTNNQETIWTGQVVIPGGDNCEVEVNISNMNDGSFIAIFKDVTHWRDQQEKIVNLQKRQNKLIQSLPHGIMTADGNLCINVVNDTFEDMTGTDKKDLVGKKVEEVSNLFEGVKIADIAYEVLMSGKIYRASDIKITRRDKRSGVLHDLRVIRYADDESFNGKSVLIMLDKTTGLRRANSSDGVSDEHVEGKMREKQSGEGIANGIYVIGNDSDFLEMMCELVSEESFLCEAMSYSGVTHEFLSTNGEKIKLIFIDTSATTTSIRNVVDNIYEANSDVRLVLCIDSDFKFENMEISKAKIYKTVKKPFLSSDIRRILNSVFKM